MLTIVISNNYNNEKLNLLLSQKDTTINETILNYGVILYENQKNIIKDLTIDNDIQIKNNELDKIKEELILNKQKYDDMIKNMNIEKEKEINTILNLKKEEDKKLKDDYFIKEKEYESMIYKIENDKIIQRDKYFKEINEIEQKIKNQYENKIKYLEYDIDKLKTEKTLEITALIDKGKQITKDDYEKIIELHNKMNDDLKTAYDNQIKCLNDKNNNLEQNIYDLNNKLLEYNTFTENKKYEAINGNISILNNKVSNYFDKIFKGNTEKGIFGETFIENYLTDKFTNGKIIDSHKEFAKGDMFFIFDKVKTLIESKNVQVLKREDIDKFYRDVEIRLSKDEINSALLISLHDTNLINGKRHFHFEIKNNIPIIMISNVFNNTEFIRFSILILNYLIKNGYANNETDDEKLYFIINSLNDIFISFKNQIIFLQNDKQMLLKMEESFRKRETDLFNIDKLLKNIFIKFPEYSMNLQNNNEENINSIIIKIKNKLETDSNFVINIKNLEELNISNNTIRKNGGIKKIIETMKMNDAIKI